MISRLAVADPRAAASLLVMQRALDWYIEEAASAQAPPISGEDAVRLRAVLAGAGAWSVELFDRLITLGQALSKLTELGHGPGGNVADGLTALGTVDVIGAGAGDALLRPWRFDGNVDEAAFAKLQFRETSLGIEKARRDNREGWWAHAQRNGAFINETAAALPERKLAIVLGAGSPFDLPLVELGQSFERVRLIDIDGTALAETVAGVWKNPADRARIETRTLDLTGINGDLVRRIEAIVGDPGLSAAEVETRMTQMCRSYRLSTPLRWGDDEDKADLIVSSCVISQLAWPQRTWAERQFEARFGPMPAAVEARWSTAWSELGLRVQQDHINALGDAANCVVLSSDVISHPTALDPGGTERDTGKQILALGVGSLRERIPTFYQVGRQGSWPWGRYRPARKGNRKVEGSRMDVEAVVLTDRTRTSSGLWLPTGGM